MASLIIIINLHSALENGCHFGHGLQRGVHSGQVFTLLLPLFFGTLGCLSFVSSTNTIALPSASAPGQAGKGRYKGNVEGFSSFRVRSGFARGLYIREVSQNNTTTKTQSNNPVEKKLL